MFLRGERGVDTPMHTMINHDKTFLSRPSFVVIENTVQGCGCIFHR